MYRTVCFRDNLNPMFDRYYDGIYLRGEGKVEATPIEQLSSRQCRSIRLLLSILSLLK